MFYLTPFPCLGVKGYFFMFGFCVCSLMAVIMLLIGHLLAELYWSYYVFKDKSNLHLKVPRGYDFLDVFKPDNICAWQNVYVDKE